MNVFTPSNIIETEVEAPAGATFETITTVKHYTDDLFSFRTTRPSAFRFRSGEFVMIGLTVGDKPLYRAYSIASPSWDEELEFFSIKVEDGPLTKHLQKIKPGDKILIKKKPTGTLVNDALIQGKRLYMLSTGTGFAPFASLIRDPETYEKFDELIVTHTCRQAAELQYGVDIVEGVKKDEMLNELFDTSKLIHFTSLTRESHAVEGRITDLITTKKFFEAIDRPAFDPAIDRVMICGSTAMIKDTKTLLESAGLGEGANNRPGEFVIERAFVG